MAGIGIELRELSEKDTFLGGLRAHLYAGVLSSGSWIISIAVLIGIYFYIQFRSGFQLFNIQFLVSITYLISLSLVLSGIFQHTLNRYIADRVFDNRLELICPNFLSSAFALTIISAVLGFGSVEMFLANLPWTIKFLMASSFVVLNLVWLFSNTLAGLKNYQFVFFSFLISYVAIFLLAINLYQYQLLGLLLAFYIGHVLLLLLFFIFLLVQFPPRRLFRLEIFQFMKRNPALIYSGLFFYLGLWVDKYCFWFNPNTSTAVLESLRASPFYDMPVFIAFILMIPGMSIFFYAMEVDFSRYYQRYYDAIREGATLNELHEKRNELIARARVGLLNTFKVQAALALFTIIFASPILQALGLTQMYVFLLRIVIVASSLLLIFISQLNFLYYLNMQYKVLYLTILFFVLNLVFTCLSFYLGPLYYGYGFAVALLLCICVAMIALNHSFRKLTYYSFMLN